MIVDQPTRDALVDVLRGALASGPPLRFAILFGSRAREHVRRDSDVDVAIAPVQPLSLAEEHALAVEIERHVGVPVDLVVVEHASAALRWRIARDGAVIMSSPPTAAPRFLADAGIEHDDVRELEQDAQRRFRAAVARSSSEAR